MDTTDMADTEDAGETVEPGTGGCGSQYEIRRWRQSSPNEEPP